MAATSYTTKMTQEYTHKTALGACCLISTAAMAQASTALKPATMAWLTLSNALLVMMVFLVVALVIKVRHTSTKLSKLRADLNHLSRTDHLTQLFKRHYFEKRLYEVFERHIRNKSSNSVLMLVEIDQMNEIKKSGQTAKELVIQRVVKIILERVRNTDLSGRFADDTFIILLRDTTIEPATKLATELQAKISEAEINYGSQAIHTTCSFGLAAYATQMDSCIDWIRNADQALNKHKNQATNHLGIH